MKRIALSLVVSLSLPSLAIASDRDENLTAPRISRTQKLESQLQHWEIALKNAKASGGKKRNRAAKIEHCYDMVTSLQTQLTQLRKLEKKKARRNRVSAEVITSSHNSDNHLSINLPYLQVALSQEEKQLTKDFLSKSEDVKIILKSQQEYTTDLSDAYMKEFIPFVNKHKNSMNQAIIPDTLCPRTVVHIPHVNGALELELKGSATSCREYLQSFVLEFLDKIGRNESAKNTKGVLENIYFENDINQTRQHLAKWIEEAIKTHNKKAQANQELRDQFKPQGVQMNRGGGMFTMSTNNIDDLMHMLALSQLPVIERLTSDDQDKIQQMIQTAKIVSLNTNENIIFSISNFKGVQK